jgi:AcrR family transcriptional regulator
MSTMAGAEVAHLTAVQRQRRQVTVDALVAAANRGMIEHGLDVSMDDIAALAQVSRRTAFRYFTTREDLLSAAVAASATNLHSVPEYAGDDWQSWLRTVALERHRANLRAGRLHREFTARPLPTRLSHAYAGYQRALHHFFHTVADVVWQAADGGDPAPQPLRQIVAVHLSPMFTQAVVVDAAGTAELAADMAADGIVTAVHRLQNRRNDG